MPHAITRLSPSLGKVHYVRDIDSGDTDIDSYDAFGRLRVSEPANRFDAEFTYDKQPLLMEEYVDGSATITHDSTYRDVRLLIGDEYEGTYALFCSSYDTPYTPACSQVIDITGTLDLSGLGNGSMHIYHKAFGVTTEYDQDQWIYATKADGCDWTMSQIFSIDFQSLKVGRIRFYIVREGAFQTVHEIYNDNIRATGFWELPSLRPYWKIYNDSGKTISEIGYSNGTCGIGFRYKVDANSTASMSAICATVKSEGGLDLFDMAGFPCATGDYVTSKTVANTLIPILSIKVMPTFKGVYNHSIVIPEEVTLVVDNPICYRLILNGTLTNSNFVAVDSNSSVYKDISATAIANGTILDEDYAASGTTRSLSTTKALGRIVLSSNFDGLSGDVLTIAAVRTSNSSAATLSRMRWREIR